MISLVIICPVLDQVVLKVDNAIHWINLSTQWVMQLISLILICWIAIYLVVDSVIQRLNNWSLSGSLTQWTRVLANHPNKQEVAPGKQNMRAACLKYKLEFNFF